MSNNISILRRDILKTGLALGATMCSLPLLAGTAEAATGNTTAPSETPSAMKTRILGHGDYSMEVSALGFGVMGMTYNRGVSPDRKTMIRLLHQAVERGITLFDTAQVYGPLTNEELAGDALAPFKGKINITTKFGHRIVNGQYIHGELDSTPANIRRVAEESLKRLKVDTIELFYQHRIDPAVPIEDVAGTVKDLIREGKVRRFGLCEVNAQTIRRAHSVQPVTAVQSEYHLMWRAPEKDIFPVLTELGIGFVPYSPINRGFLGGNITEYTRFDSGNDNRNILPRFTPESIRANLRIVEKLHEFGRPRGLTSSQIALAWLMTKAPWIVPIPGTTKRAHLEENLYAAEIHFSDAEMQQIEKIVSDIPVMGDRYPVSQQKQVEAS